MNWRPFIIGDEVAAIWLGDTWNWNVKNDGCS